MTQRITPLPRNSDTVLRVISHGVEQNLHKDADTFQTRYAALRGRKKAYISGQITVRVKAGDTSGFLYGG
jgi:hypothetical protein